jgi:LuxR family transcriptional regulator, maltose regulon positive regulatory protein
MEKVTQEMASIHHTPLLATKLHMPRPSARLVHRSLLDERLAGGISCALTLISAPAGFGKTTLLSDFLNRSGTSVAWLSLEREDNDLVRFLTYVIAALQTLDQEIGRTSLALLQSSTPATMEPMLALLINDLVSVKLPSFVLVLDDYHVIEDPAIQHALTSLVEHLPAQMHLIIMTRSDPPLPLARLRGRGQLCEVRATDLRFATEDVEAFLHGVMHLDLSADEVAILQDRTEGWIAGIQLAALSLRGRTDVSAFLTDFSGSHRFVLDYLSEEVFLQQTQPELIPALHRRASRWYKQHGFLDEAIEHALAGADYPVAARLIEQVARTALRSRGASSILLRWMEALPKTWLDTHPQMAVLYAWVVVSFGVRPWSEIEPWLQGIREALPAQDPTATELAGEMAVMRTIAAEFVEEHARAIELSDQTLALLPADHWRRGLMLLYRGAALLSLQRVEEAIATLKQAVALNEAEGSQQLVLIGKSHLANAYVLRGQLQKAVRLYREVLQQKPAHDPPLVGPLLAHGGLGNLFREWNDFPSALVHLQAGLELDRYVGGLLTTKWAVYLPLARVYLAQGRREEAFAALSHIAEATRTASSAPSPALVSAWRARFHLALGDVDAADRWANDAGLSLAALRADLADLTLHEMTSMTLARLAIEQEQARAALPLLEHLLTLAAKTHRTTSALELLIIQSQAYEAIGQREQALALLKQALQRAETEGYMRLFLDEGAPIVKLLLNLRETTPEQQAYIQLLLAASTEHETMRPVDREEHPQRSQLLVDPLSERELEVLQLIAAGASNEEIAERLVIAIGTVKRHVSNILGKLTVSNRTQAVARAQAIGLLSIL